MGGGQKSVEDAELPEQKSDAWRSSVPAFMVATFARVFLQGDGDDDDDDDDDGWQPETYCCFGSQGPDQIW